LGGSIIDMWKRMKPLVDAEREHRRGGQTHRAGRLNFENLYLLVSKKGPMVSAPG
jgi:hypothetical protein